MMLAKKIVLSALAAALIAPAPTCANTTYLNLLQPSALYSTLANHKLLSASIAALTTVTAYKHRAYKQQLKWDWKAIEASTEYPVKASDLPQGFLWGAGTSSYQVEGNCTNSSYATWEQQSPEYKHQAGIACDHWNRYKEDIALMHQLGIKAYRFSLEWSKIEPVPGTFDDAALMHYVDVCAELLKYNIKPVIEFHHYSDPQWFIDQGGFAKEENIKLFKRFCTTVTTRLMKELPQMFTTHNRPFFLTFNSPAAYATNGYYMGTRPPGERNMERSLTVLKNMLEAHVQVYQAIKKHPAGIIARVGTTHNIFQLDPGNWFNPLAQVKCYFGDKISHTCVYDFFRTGDFAVNIPGLANVNHQNPKAPQSLDFIGLNYYGHGYMPVAGGPARPNDEVATDNPRYTIYAEGLYRGIKEISENIAQPLSIPIYVTENGIGTKDGATRDLFLKRYMYALTKAINDGHMVNGYIHWSFMDNYEWGSFDIPYGIVEVDFKTKEEESRQPLLTRSVRKGSEYLVKLMQDQKESA